MDSEGWHYHAHRRELEGLFWKTFQANLKARSLSDADLHLMRAGRMAELFYRYGLIFDSKSVVPSVRMDQGDGSLAYLDAFRTANEWAPFS
ncbi:hypothetical protein BDW74DRAFT_147734 [Aspergillus multicolor]|uniref:uncharacterized protein n=1 Tax=Aspergillus multicolor TaxID=41759 RepID=UPI003CCCDD6D